MHIKEIFLGRGLN